MGGERRSSKMAQEEKAEAKKSERRLEKQIELAASSDEVWKLITEPKTRETNGSNRRTTAGGSCS
jgi:hypothetical protein